MQLFYDKEKYRKIIYVYRSNYLLIKIFLTILRRKKLNFS